MSNRDEKEIIKVDLTQKQSDEIEADTGKPADATEVPVKELEPRIAPSLGWGKNSNETLLVD